MRLCAACNRHVKASTCPFCGAAENLPTTAAPQLAARLSRSELMAGVALLGALAGGCSKTEPGGPAAHGSSTPSASTAEPEPQPEPPAFGVIYGGPPERLPTTPATDAGTPQPPSPPAPMPVPAYGAPPPEPPPQKR